MENILTLTGTEVVYLENLLIGRQLELAQALGQSDLPHYDREAFCKELAEATGLLGTLGVIKNGWIGDKVAKVTVAPFG